MKKVLKVWPVWLPGLKYHDHYLADEMERDGVVTYFALPNFIPKEYSDFVSSEEDFVVRYKVKFLKFRLLFGKPVPYDLFGFVRYLKELKPDVIHIFGISNFTTLFVFFAIFIAGAETPVVFNDHSDPLERKKGLSAWIYYVFFRICYLLFIGNKYPVVVPDGATGKELVRRYGVAIKRKLCEISLGYDSRVFNIDCRSKKVDEDALVIGFAGKINSKKNLKELICAVSLFPANQIHLILCGFNADDYSEYQKEVLSYAKSFPNLSFKAIPFIMNPDLLSKFYASLDVAVFPGAISITTLEASGCGVPVILKKSYEGLEHRVDGGRGFLFDDLKGLVRCIEYYINQRKTSGINFNEIANSSLRYSWAKVKLQYYCLYGFDV